MISDSIDMYLFFPIISLVRYKILVKFGLSDLRSGNLSPIFNYF